MESTRTNKFGISLIKDPANVPIMNAPDPTFPPTEIPLPKKRRWPGTIALFIFVTISLLVLMGARSLLLIFKAPTTSMSPAVRKGEIVLMEGFSYLVRQPRRGEIIVFKTGGIQGIPNPPGVSSQYWFKRVAGVPGDRVRIAGGQLFINEHAVPMTNQAGEIHYTTAKSGTAYLKTESDTITVPSGFYFVLGDNSQNSFDSRYWGPVPSNNIKGRIVFQ